MGLLELLQKIPGQSDMLGQLMPHVIEPKNSYFFIGPEETGAVAVAISFAKAIMCEDHGCGICEVCMSIENGVHPDVYLYERIGSSLTVEDAIEIRSKAYRSTSGSKYQIIILPELELVGRAGPVLLKCVEEPPLSTIFLMQSSLEISELRTLMSRSVILRLSVASEQEISGHLLGLGVPLDKAQRIVQLSAGSLQRALEIYSDEELKVGMELWMQIPDLLVPEISRIISLVDRLLEIVNLVERRRIVEQKKEISDLEKIAESLGVKKKTLTDKAEARHKRELRRIRTRELRAGLLLFERQYRDQLILGDPSPGKVEQALFAIREIEVAQIQFRRNANEFLILVALLTRLAGNPS